MYAIRSYYGLLLGLVLLVGRAAQVQLLEGDRWAEAARARRTDQIVLAARRGTLYDRHGTSLAVTQETYRVGVAPNELRRPTADWDLVARRLGRITSYNVCYTKLLRERLERAVCNSASTHQ